jgi:hypothetical protein
MSSGISSGDFDGFTKNMILSVLFFVATPIVIISSLISLMSLSRMDKDTIASLRKSEKPQVLALNDTNEVKTTNVLAALPSFSNNTTISIGSSDTRAELIRTYLEYYKSPLVPLANFIVQISDKYGIDYRLIPAIAQQESNLCKVIPEGSYNCWGWGIHSKGSLGFTSYEEAIDTVSKGLKEEYIDKGFTNPEEIMSKYTPMSQGSWAFGVSHFMEEMENVSK